MLENSQLKPITGTFVSPLPGDTGINNYGLEEWETDFRLMRAIGIDTIIVINCELENDGRRLSALDPRSTTWAEDPNILSMFFRLSEKYGMKLYLGGTLGITNLHLGEWRNEIRENEEFYDKMLTRFGSYSCWQGIYITLEALPWHFNFFDVLIGVVEAARRLAPEKKTLLSPSFFPRTGNMVSRYTVEDFIRVWRTGFFEKVAGKLDYCAPQDTFTVPECRYGVPVVSKLEQWYAATSAMLHDYGVGLWANIETFQRPYTFNAESEKCYRQIDYRSLYMKLQSALPYAEKLITFEFTSCMSPNAEWGSSSRLLDRYLEMIGVDKQVVRDIMTFRKD